MSIINKVEWHEVDKYLEEAFIDGVRFVRPKNDKVVSLDCPGC